MKQKLIKSFLITLFFLMGSSSLFAQTTTLGKNFWVSFGYNMGKTSATVNLELKIVTKNATQVTLSYTENSTLEKVLNIPAQSVYTYIFDIYERSAIYGTQTTGTTQKSLYISSTDTITVYGFDQTTNSTSVTTLLPTKCLGMDYYQISYIPWISNTSVESDGYIVVATENDTDVYVNGTQVAALNKGGVYSFYGNVSDKVDYTGTHITSSRPVAFFVANTRAFIPSNASSAGDCLFQQLPPIEQWGKNFLVPNTIQSKGRVRVLAAHNGTNITQVGATGPILIDGTKSTGSQTSLTNLQAGQFVELEFTTNGCYINADKPVGVGAYMVSNQYGGSVGDPALAWIPPIQQTTNSVLIAPFIPLTATSLTHHYALIITPTAEKANTTLSINGAAATPLSGVTWIDNIASGYSFASYQFSNESTNSYRFSNSDGLFVNGYGYGGVESYYYVAASATRNLSPAFYVNDIHYQDLPAEVFTVHDIDFRAEIDGTMSANAGHLKWYINGAEEATAQDQLTWSKNLPNGIYQIKMTVLMDDNVSVKTIESTLTIGSPFSIEICEGASVIFTADTINGGPNPTFQWKKNRVDIPGANGLTYTYAPQNNDTITCVMVSDANCADPTIVTSHNIVVTVYGAPIPGTIGNNQSICYNTAPAALSEITAVTGGNGPYNYQWQKAGNINGTYVDITGATNPLELSPAQMGANLTQTSYYRRQVTDACGSTAYSDTITITVYDDLVGGAIGSDQSICYNTAPAALAETTAVTGGNGLYNYQWQKADNINGPYINIDEATNLLLSPIQMGANLTQTSYYRRQVSDACGNTAYSDTITITVYDDLVGGTIGNNQIICYNIAPTALNEITPAAGGNGLYNYQWQKADNINGPYINIDEATNLLLSPIQMGANLTQTSYYRRQVTDACGTAYSDTITITVYDDLVGGAIGSDQTICYNTAPATLPETTAAAGGNGTYGYQWQSSANGIDGWTDIEGASSAAYTPGPLTSTTYYRRGVTSGACAIVYGNTVVITVTPIVVPSITISATIN